MTRAEMIAKIKEVYARDYGSPAAEMAELLEALGILKYDDEPKTYQVHVYGAIPDQITYVSEDEMLRVLTNSGWTLTRMKP
jgi:hypothetical protein